LKKALLPVVACGAFGWDGSAAVGLLGSEEQPDITPNPNPAAKIATNSFFICDFPIGLLV
jgi:hypothetical protein